MGREGAAGKILFIPRVQKNTFRATNKLFGQSASRKVPFLYFLYFLERNERDAAAMEQQKCCKYCGKPFAALNICIISRMAHKKEGMMNTRLFFSASLKEKKKSFFPKKEHLGLEPVNPGQSLFKKISRMRFP